MWCCGNGITVGQGRWTEKTDCQILKRKHNAAQIYLVCILQCGPAISFNSAYKFLKSTQLITCGLFIRFVFATGCLMPSHKCRNDAAAAPHVWFDADVALIGDTASTRATERGWLIVSSVRLAGCLPTKQDKRNVSNTHSKCQSVFNELPHPASRRPPATAAHPWMLPRYSAKITKSVGKKSDWELG